MCAIVLRYCRMAPIADVSREYKAAASSSRREQYLQVAAKANLKLKDQFNGVVAKWEQETSRLYDLIAKVEKACGPRQFVINRKTRMIHKVLTTVTDVGMKAIAYCGLKYPLADVSMAMDLPVAERNFYCSTCLADVRATLGGSATQVG